jgi:hypothetical protein
MATEVPVLLGKTLVFSVLANDRKLSGVRLGKAFPGA